MIVVDASALTDFLLGRPSAVAAIESAFEAREGEPLHAPELVEPETLNALRRLANAGAVDARRATEAVANLGRMRMVRYPHAPLRQRVWELRHELSAYDATYLALAEGLGAALLLTADRGLAGGAIRRLGSGRVQHVA
ncbi:MAG TPA: type II toxin-antitoxin system VapC family toxin [Thermoleophilaceae bacterium]|nr:type II toxin-antitoxin system VapC family toxin [Thermoleophilaceae bacterium]